MIQLFSLVPHVVFSSGIRTPFIIKPFSNNNGNRFNLAVFWRRGECPHKTINNAFGYFNIQLLFTVLLNLLNLQSLNSINEKQSIVYHTINLKG